MAYKSIHEGFWTHPKLKKELEPLERYLYSYFITCPNSHFTGLYYLPKVTMMDESGLKRKELDRGMDTLIDRGILCYDESKDIVFVKNMLKYQVKNANPNKKQKAGIVSHLATLHNSLLIKDFVNQYPHLGLKFDIPMDTPMDGGTQNTVIKTVNKTKQNKTILKTMYAIYFNIRWERYPMKDSREKALGYWLASVKDWKDLVKFDKALDNYLGHLSVESWKKPQSGKTFFNNWRDWVDWVEPEGKPGGKTEPKKSLDQIVEERDRKEGVVQHDG